MTSIEKHDNYDTISDNVRRLCAQKYAELEKALHPYVSGEYGDIQPGHAQAYITCLKELGRLYQTHKPPRQDQDVIPLTQHEQLMAQAQERLEQAVAAAVELAEQRVRAQLEGERGVDVQVARAAVLEKLSQVRLTH